MKNLKNQLDDCFERMSGNASVTCAKLRTWGGDKEAYYEDVIYRKAVIAEKLWSIDEYTSKEAIALLDKERTLFRILEILEQDPDIDNWAYINIKSCIDN